jgi:hypothetical protein
MHFLFNVLRIKGVFIFLSLLAHPQKALHKRQLVYCVRVMLVGCTRVEVELDSLYWYVGFTFITGHEGP